MAYVKRSQWGAAPAKARNPWDITTIQGLALHHSASPAQAKHSNCAASVRAIQSYHLSKNYSDIAYSFVVCAHGDIFVGTGWRNHSEANGAGHNLDWLAVCLLGNAPDITPARSRAIYLIRRGLLKRAPQAKRVVPHSELVSTACPGDDARAYIGDKGYAINCAALTKAIHDTEARLNKLRAKAKRGRCA